MDEKLAGQFGFPLDTVAVTNQISIICLRESDLLHSKKSGTYKEINSLCQEALRALGRPEDQDQHDDKYSEKPHRRLLRRKLQPFSM